MPGVIIPRKTVAELRKLLDEESGEVEVALSDTRIQFRVGPILLTSKLIDGTFPEYERVIPRDNDKVLRVGKKDFADAVGARRGDQQRAVAAGEALARAATCWCSRRPAPTRAPRPRSWNRTG